MAKTPVEQQQTATAYYASRDFDVSFFPAIWHTFKVGHLITTDLERICQKHDISIADFHLMGAIRTEETTPQRAADLAHWLNVSHAVLSTRIKRLSNKGLLSRSLCPTDKRAFILHLTEAGIAIIDAANDDIRTQCHFVSCFHQLPRADQDALVRIMGQLHNQLDRFFIPDRRG